MDDTLDEVIINSASTINRLEQLVQERCWESVLAHLQTKQGCEDARKRNSNTGELLYHDLAFYYHAPFHIIEALVKAYPEGILEPDTSRNQIRYPIETAVAGTKDETANMVFNLFVETNPKCLDNCAVSFIYAAFQECDTEVLKLMIQTNPNFLYKKDSKYSKFGLPIHGACSMGMCQKIDILLTFDPSQAQLVDEDSKMLPLHRACLPFDMDSIFNIETFKRLIEAFPQAAKEKDVKGRLPLHYACDAALYRPDNQNFVSELLKIYPQAAHIRDNRKNLPLHCMQQHFAYGEDSFDLRIEKQLIVLIETYPDALLHSNGENQLVLGSLAKSRCPLHQVWHIAGSLCTHAFICVTCKSLQPLYHMSFDLPALVENFMDCPLDCTTNESDMQDGELAGIILYYTFEALSQANHGLDSKSNLPSSDNVVRPCLPDDNNYSTFKTTLLHKLAYCSKFCAQEHMRCAVEQYALKNHHHFCQADNNGNLPLHLVCCAPTPLILVGVHNRSFGEKTEASLVETFLTPYMEAASKTNHLGKTPLDILMETNSELSELNIKSWHGVELLVNANPTEANKLFTKDKLCPFMLAAIGKQASLSCTFSMLLSFILVQNLDDLQTTKIVTRSKSKVFHRND